MRLVVCVLLMLCVEPQMAAMNRATFLGSVQEGVQSAMGLNVEKIEEVVFSMGKNMFSEGQTMLQTMPQLSNAWDTVIAPGMSKFLGMCQASPSVTQLAGKPLADQLKSFEEYANGLLKSVQQDKTPTLLQLSEEDEPEQNDTLIVLSLIQLCLVLVLIGIMATTAMFQKPRRTVRGKVVTLCLKGMPHFICTRRRLGLFMVVLPIIVVLSMFVVASASRNRMVWGSYLIFWNLFSALFVLRAVLSGEIDNVAGNFRMRIREIADPTSSTTGRLSNVVEVSVLPEDESDADETLAIR